LSHEGADKPLVDGELFELAKALKGKSYGLVYDVTVERWNVGLQNRDVWKWLKAAMES